VVAAGPSAGSMRRVSSIQVLVSTGLAAVLLLLPSLILGTLPADSAPQNLTWAGNFSEQFRAGILYPRWMHGSFQGLGSPAFYLYPPLAFWFDAALSVVTGNLLAVSWRLSLDFALLLWGSGLAMNAWLRTQVDRRAALIGAIGYMAAPYHLFDHYWRGAYAEFAAYAVLPLVVLAIARVASNQRGAPVMLALAYAALVMAHLPTALLISLTAVPAHVLFCALRSGNSRASIGVLLRCSLAGVLGLGVAATYLLPAMTLQSAASTEHLWDVAFQVDTWFLLFMPIGRVSPALVIILCGTAAAWGLAALAVLVRLVGRSPRAERDRETIFWALLGVVCLLLMSGLVSWLWHVVPMMSKVQFPWRLMIVVEFAMVTALCLMPWPAIGRVVRLLFCAALAALVASVGVLAAEVGDRIKPMLQGRRMLPMDAKEYLPAGYPHARFISDLGLEPLAGVLLIACSPAPQHCQAEQGPFGSLSLQVEGGAPTTVVLRRFVFPGWRLDPALPIVASEPLRLVSFVVPAGRHAYRLQRESLPQEKVGWAISGASLALLLAWALLDRRSR